MDDYNFNMILTNLMEEKDLYEEITRKLVAEISKDLVKLNQSSEFSKIEIDKLIDQISLQWKQSFHEELDVAVKKQRSALISHRFNIMKMRCSLMNTLGKAEIDDAIEEKHVAKGYLNRMMPLIQGLCKEQKQFFPVRFALKEDLSITSLGCIQCTPIEAKSLKLQCTEEKILNVHVMFFVEIPNEYDMNEISEHFSWNVRVDGDEVTTISFISNYKFQIEFFIAKDELHTVSFFMYRQHISGSPFEFHPCRAQESELILEKKEPVCVSSSKAYLKSEDAVEEFLKRAESIIPSEPLEPLPLLSPTGIATCKSNSTASSVTNGSDIPLKPIRKWVSRGSKDPDVDELLASLRKPLNLDVLLQAPKATTVSVKDVARDDSDISEKSKNLVKRGARVNKEVRTPFKKTIDLITPMQAREPTAIPVKTEENLLNDELIYSTPVKEKENVKPLSPREKIIKEEVTEDGCSLRITISNNIKMEKYDCDDEDSADLEYRDGLVQNSKNFHGDEFDPQPAENINREVATEKDGRDSRVVVPNMFDKQLVAEHIASYCGESDIRLNSPTGIVELPSGDIAVADTFGNRLLLFDGNCRFKRIFNADRTLYRPSALVVVGDRFLAVKDDAIIALFSLSCNYMNTIGRRHLRRPFGLAVNEDENLITIDTDQDMSPLVVVILNPRTGQLVRSIAIQNLFLGDSLGSFKPRFIAFHPPNRLYVVDLGNDVVYIIDTELERLLKVFGRRGSRNGEFWDPSGVVLDREGLLLIADSRQHRIQMFTKDGEFVSLLEVDRPLNRPSGMFLTRDGVLLVLNYWENSLVKYQLKFSQ